MKTLFTKDICADPQRFVITLFTMSLAMTPPERGAALRNKWVLLRIMSIEQLFAFQVDGDVLVVCFSIAQNRYPDRRPANSEYQSVNVHV